MENQPYAIETVYLTGGSMEQTVEIQKLGGNPDDFRKDQIRTYEIMLQNSFGNISGADTLRNQIIASGDTVSKEAKEKLDEVEKRARKSKIELTVANAALNFFANEPTAHGFAGIQINLESGNKVLVSGGYFTDAVERISQYDKDGQKSDLDIDKVLESLSKVQSAVTSLTIAKKDGRSTLQNTDIQYLQPDVMKDVKIDSSVDKEK